MIGQRSGRVNENRTILSGLPSGGVEDRIVILRSTKVVAGVCLGACILMLPGCRASGSAVVRQQRIRPQAQEDVAEHRAPVNQSNVPRNDVAPLPAAAEEEKSSHGADGELGYGRPSEGIDGVTVGAGAHEAAARGGDDPPAVPGADTADDGRDDGDPDGLASGMPDQEDGDTVQRETANGGAFGQEGSASSGPAITPVIPARVEKTASTAPGEIVYPEAPPPIAVSREQVDALRLPSTDPKRPIIGIWEQVRGDNSADFAEGNYTRTALVFRTDGVLEVVRWFGSDNEIRLDSKLNYTVTAGDRIRLELPRGSSGASRRAYSIPLGDGMSVLVQPIKTQFPAALRFKQDNGELVIDGKTYRHVDPR